ncbi:MAG: TlpA disulfide reductase family protein, partial [Oscillospiraceae bacterium]
MNTKTKSLLGIVAFIIFIILAGVTYKLISENYKPESLSSNIADEIKAEDFSVTDKDGNMVKLSDFFGKPIVVNFWASWCPPCKQEMPDFNKVYGELKDDVVFMMINATDGQRETVKKANSYLEEHTYDFPVYFDTQDQNAMYTYGVSALPSTLFINKDG